MAVNTGQTAAPKGPYDPREGGRSEYFKKVQKDLNKRFNSSGMKKKKTATTVE